MNIFNRLINSEDIARKSSLLIFIGGLLATTGVLMVLGMEIFYINMDILEKIITHPFITIVFPLILCIFGGYLMYRGIILADQINDVDTEK